ncbi:unnamed protein product, partial [marine sediment metagenome]
MPCILGYNHVLTEGMREIFPTYSLPHPNEVELSELLCEVIPCAEMVRLGKNGSDVTTAAVRLARAITGRDLVLQCGYHGWHDWYIGNTKKGKGVPEGTKKMTIPFDYNSFIARLKDPEVESRVILEKHKRGAACVIMEPTNFHPPKEGFLSKIRDWCDRTGTLLIFDEMVTGFRWSLGGAQEYFGVHPDLACFGKAMANGYPISAVVGREEFMRHFGD